MSFRRSYAVQIAGAGGVVLGGAIAGVIFEREAYPGDETASAADLAVAVAFLVAAAISRAGGPARLLLALTGATWIAGSVSGDLALLHRGPLAQLLVTAPDGRPRTPAEWTAVASGYLAAVVHEDAVTIVAAIAVAGVALGRCLSEDGARRHARAPAALAPAGGPPRGRPWRRGWWGAWEPRGPWPGRGGPRTPVVLRAGSRGDRRNGD